ncbi:Uncharacterised protein [Mycobacteroides abscessus subsp. abscessus]|nr:Uncharacterised protein [Mycobacteroides abscessus subsp. abscessus]
MDHHDLLAVHRDRHIDAIFVEEGLGPDTSGDHDGVGGDGRVVGEFDSDDTLSVGQQTGNGGALFDSDTGSSRRRRERLRGLIRIAIATAFFPAERGERFEIGCGPELCHLGDIHLLGLHSDLALGCQAFPEVLDVGLSDPDHVAGLSEADVGAEDLLGLLEHLEADGGHGRERTDTVVAADDARRLAGHSSSDGIALAHNDIGDAALRQCPGGRDALEATADDDDGCGFGTHRPAPVPGIQLVPASGTRAMAAASIEIATRSSGSR